MEIKDILIKVDHTLLSPVATWDEIKALCDDGLKYEVASVCIPASYVKEVALYINKRIKVCTVVGFPNGYSTTATKCFEAQDAIKNGADEIDVVINIGWLKDKKYDLITNELAALRKACQRKILKVIIEVCLLTEEEKIKMCELVSDSGADYIKTSTGFSTGGATKEDIVLFRKYCDPEVMIKAAGGIRSISDAIDFVNLGADRLGTSSIVKIIKKTII